MDLTVGHGILFLEPLGDRHELGLRRGLRDALLQPRQHGETRTLAPFQRAGVQLQGHPHVMEFGEPEIRRHDAHHGRRACVHPNRLADNLGIPIVAILPDVMAQQNDRLPRDEVVFRQERATHHGLLPQHGKRAGGQVNSRIAVCGLSREGEVGRRRIVRRHLVEDGLLLAPIQVIVQPHGLVELALGNRGPEGKDPFHVRVIRAAKHDAVNDGIHGGGEADAEGQHQDRHAGNPPTHAKQSESKREISA